MRERTAKKIKSRPSVVINNEKKSSPTLEPSVIKTFESTPPTPIPTGARPSSQEGKAPKAQKLARLCIVLSVSFLSHVLDPMTLFEDTVAELLEALDEGETEASSRLLSPFDIKQVAHSIKDLSKKDLLKDVQIDTMASLLKYLDTATNHFDSAFTFPLEDQGTEEDDQVLHRGFDKTILSLDHVSLSLAILSSQGLQHLFPEELLINSLNVFKSFVEKFMAPALEYSKDDPKLTKGYTFKSISSNPALRQRMVALVSSTCEISGKLRKSCSAELSDGIIVKLVYIALSLFFIDTSSEMMVGLTEAESLKQAGSGLLRTVS